MLVLGVVEWIFAVGVILVLVVAEIVSAMVFVVALVALAGLEEVD